MCPTRPADESRTRTRRIILQEATCVPIRLEDQGFNSHFVTGRVTADGIRRAGANDAFTCGPPGTIERLPASAAASASATTRSGATHTSFGNLFAKEASF